MRAYFKYTSGESYQLNNLDYTGFFNVDEEGNVYTGKTKTSESLELSKKNTFLSNIYTDKIELNTTYKNIDRPISYLVNTFDILNKEGIDKIAKIINYNNLITFKGLLIDNPKIYSFKNNKNHYYSLSGPNQTELFGKTDYSFSYPFTFTKWEFLDRIISGVMVIDDEENFSYLCTTGDYQYIIKGSFVNKNPLNVSFEKNIIDDPINPEYTYEIYQDEDENRVIFVNNDYINIYDSSNFSLCDSLILIDKIKLDFDTTIEHFIWDITNYEWDNFEFFPTEKFNVLNDNNPNSIKFGKNVRTQILDNILYIKNKYSIDLYNSINLKNLGIDNVLDINIRNIDDLIIILHKNEFDFKITIIDLDDIENAKTFILKSINQNTKWIKIKFSTIDSDIFHIYNEVEYQTRHLSNPTYPSGRMENNNFYYLERYTWNNALLRYNKSKFFWNYYQRKSNRYSTILGIETFKNNKMYCLLHNYGRLITIYQDSKDRYESNLELDLEKSFKAIDCSESSIGLFLNLNTMPIISDSLSIYNKSTGGYNINENNISKISYDNLLVDLENFYIHGNENINVLTLQRILFNIIDLQNEILSKSIIETEVQEVLEVQEVELEPEIIENPNTIIPLFPTPVIENYVDNQREVEVGFSFFVKDQNLNFEATLNGKKVPNVFKRTSDHYKSGYTEYFGVVRNHNRGISPISVIMNNFKYGKNVLIIRSTKDNPNLLFENGNGFSFEIYPFDGGYATFYAGVRLPCVVYGTTNDTQYLIIEFDIPDYSSNIDADPPVYLKSPLETSFLSENKIYPF